MILVALSQTVTIVSVTSQIHSDTHAAVSHLRRVNVRTIVVANSTRTITYTITRSLNVSHCCTHILPRSGIGHVGRLGGRTPATFINSNIGSTTTLLRTAVKLTVKTKAGITVRSTSLILVRSSPLSTIGTLILTGGACHGVVRGLF